MDEALPLPLPDADQSSKMGASRQARLSFVLMANLGLVVALVAVGVSAHSVGVWAEAADYLTDAAAIAIALVALRVEAPSPRRPRGRPNAARYGALVNATWLLVLAVLVAADATARLVGRTATVHGLPVLVMSGVAAVVMAAGAVVLRADPEGGDETSGAALTMKVVLIDTAGDAASAAGVALAGAVILATGGLYWLDPAVALVVCLVDAVSIVGLLRRTLVALRS
ncbi:MAG TPA: cation transporter [Acidimicrobiales bacterium]|nr:cation transporter [Acidimicrobiales bacterium]